MKLSMRFKENRLLDEWIWGFIFRVFLEWNSWLWEVVRFLLLEIFKLRSIDYLAVM